MSTENAARVEPASIAPPPATAAAIAAAARDVEHREAFERRLAREILKAEEFRATLLAVLPSLAMFALLVGGNAYPQITAALLHGRFDRVHVGLFLCVVAGFEFHVLAWTRKLLRSGVRASVLRRYANTLIETSLPTASIVYYATIDGPVSALLMPSAFVYFLFILLSTLRLDFLLCAFTGLVAAAEYAAVALYWDAADAGVVARSAILVISGVAAGFVARRLRKSFTRALESLGERTRILGVFGQHVSPEVVEKLVAGKADVKSERRSVCVMFLDIRNFTAFSEDRSPEQVVDYLNAVFDATIGAVVSRHGIVNKFLGDGFMAVFGAPIEEGNACAAAVDAALEILVRIDKLVEEGKIPPTQVGIGLHAGEAVVGNIGSAQRKEYTVIGDVVNVASRIESLNKEFGSRVLASDEAWTASGRTDVHAEPREPIRIRGRVQPVRIWQLA